MLVTSFVDIINDQDRPWSYFIVAYIHFCLRVISSAHLRHRVYRQIWPPYNLITRSNWWGISNRQPGYAVWRRQLYTTRWKWWDGRLNSHRKYSSRSPRQAHTQCFVQGYMNCKLTLYNLSIAYTNIALLLQHMINIVDWYEAFIDGQVSSIAILMLSIFPATAIDTLENLKNTTPPRQEKS